MGVCVHVCVCVCVCANEPKGTISVSVNTAEPTEPVDPLKLLALDGIDWSVGPSGSSPAQPCVSLSSSSVLHTHMNSLFRCDSLLLQLTTCDHLLTFADSSVCLGLKPTGHKTRLDP